MPVASLPGNVERDLLFHYAACTAGKVVDVGRVCERLRSPAKYHGPILYSELGGEGFFGELVHALPSQ